MIIAAKKFEPTFSMVCSRLVIDQEYPRDSLEMDRMLTINLAM